MPRRHVPMKDAVDVAIRSGELSTSFDPEISEWGNLLPVKWKSPAYAGRTLGELKYLSTQGKEIEMRFP